VVGVAYKKDIDDVRESPALDVIRLLQKRGAIVQYHDPHVPNLREDNIELQSVPLAPDTVQAADCVVIVTDHSDLDYALVARCARLVVDTRNTLATVRRGGNST
jgi:UDP-N-acetyl-D-glucosamine dehydrogenase